MRKAIMVLLVVGFASLILSLACDQGQRKVTIRFKFKQGMKLSYHQVAKGTYQAYRGDSLVADRLNSYTADLGWFVRRVLDDGTAEVREARSLTYMSSDKAQPPTIDTMSEQREFTSYVKPNGHVEDIEVSSGEANASLTYLKNYVEQGQPVFPANEVSEGHSWTQTTKVILPDGPMDASTTYEIKSFARERGYDCVIIEYAGNLIIPLEKSKDDYVKLVDGVDNIQAVGHIYFAYEEGIIVRQTEKWQLDGQRTYVFVKAAPDDSRYATMKVGDTVTNHIVLEYDVNHELVDLARE